MTQLFEDCFQFFPLNRKEEGFYFMKEGNLLPISPEEKFLETFFEESKAKMIPSGIKLQHFYEEFKNRIPTFNSVSKDLTPDVEIKIQSRSKEIIIKIVQRITESYKIDLEQFLSLVFSNFTKEYKDIEKYTPNEVFPFVKLIETNYKDEKLVIDDFIYQFIPREVEIKFKNNETFQKNQKMNVKVFWDSETKSIEKEENLWTNFEKFLSFYFHDKWKYHLEMKSLEEGFIKTKENLIESDEIVRKLKTSLESFSEINMEDRGSQGGVILYGQPGTGEKIIKGKEN
jgi:hypothetical protein